MWGTPSVHNDVGKCERPIDYNGKQSHESHDMSTCEQQEIKEELRKNHQPSRGWDPLVVSVLKLQSVQGALEKEIHKFGEIGKDLHSLCDDSSKSSLVEKQLEEFRCIPREKVSQIVELEATIDHRKFPKELGGTIELQQRCQEIDEELEGLLMQRIEAEVEHLAITRATDNWSKILVEYQMKLLEEQRSLAEEQMSTTRKIGDVEIRAVVLKGQAEESGTYCREISRKRVVRYTSCFLVQFILLVLVLELFFLHLLPDSSVSSRGSSACHYFQPLTILVVEAPLLDNPPAILLLISTDPLALDVLRAKVDIIPSPNATSDLKLGANLDTQKCLLHLAANSLPCAVFANFNVARADYEILESFHVPSHLRAFSDCLACCGPVDLSFRGYFFPWGNRRERLSLMAITAISMFQVISKFESVKMAIKKLNLELGDILAVAIKVRVELDIAQTVLQFAPLF
ncbi:hypothetical protein Nepgr_007731 [Nepenthes gracilis]|uniref:Uncharacterized protein n=1 Tax=Nepenthes gracilis TaxID=150966 RepID=A0AAD3S7U2_NEPGR|nr:hypothetical protein Nepgr_007731 [Nepenthes gracilis]